MIETIQGRAVCIDATHQHDTLEAAGNCGEPTRPGLTELAAIGRPGTVRASARAGSKAHLTDLTERQLDVLQMADNPSGMVSANGSTGVTRPTIRALAAKGYGAAMHQASSTRRHLIIGFEINEAGRKVVRAERGTPSWAEYAGSTSADDDTHVHPFSD